MARPLLPQKQLGGIVFVCGMPGAGKTTLAGCYVRRWAGYAPIVAFDKNGDLEEFFNGENPSIPALDPHRVVYVRTADEARIAVRRGYPDPPDVIVFSAPRNNRTIETEFVAYVNSVRECIVFVDEAESVFGPSLQPGTPARDIFELARNRGYIVIATTRRPQAVSAGLRSSAMHVAIFRMESEEALKGCKEFARVHLLTRVESLPPFHYLYRGAWRKNPHAPYKELDARKGLAPWTVR